MFVAVLLHIIILTTSAVLVAAAPTEKSTENSPSGIIIIPLTRQREARATGSDTINRRRIDPPRAREKILKNWEVGLEPQQTLILPPFIGTLVDLHGEFIIGDQSFNLIFDTLGADTKLLSPECNGCELYHKVTYTPKGDPSLAPPYIHPDDAHAPPLGKVYIDSVTIGSSTVGAQAFAVVDEMDNYLLKSTADGYIGMMGPPLVSLSGRSSLFQSLLREKQLDRAIFAFLLRPGEQCYSEVSLGGVNPKIATTDIEYIPVKSQELWSVDVTFSVSGNKVVKSQAVFDTSSDFILGNTDEVEEIYGQIPGAAVAGSEFPEGVYKVPCFIQHLPPISLTFGQSKRSFRLNAGNFMRTTPHHDCYGAIYATEGLDAWVIGSPFLYDVYSVFDVREGNAKIGFGTVPDNMRCASLASI